MKLKDKIRRWVLKLADGAPAEEYADFRKQSDDYISELLNEFSRINDRNQTLLNDRHRILKKMNDLEKLLARHREEVAAAKASPDTSKSADEMFRELGYLWEDTPLEGGRGYENEDGLKIEVTPHGVVFDPKLGSGYVFKMGKEYVLACAQLIREMEADNERSKTQAACGTT